MDILSRIEARMEEIKGIFQFAISVSLDEEDSDALVSKLKTIKKEFRSIGYEAVAMSIALKDISTGYTFDQWRQFLRVYGANHTTQVHIGLGWAMAQQQAADFSIIETLEPLMQCRVMDGYGYYEGIFRKRKAIFEMIIPNKIDSRMLHGYDQGIGRSIWYICKGDCSKIAVIVSSFPFERQKDLWRGIGIACVYVGGYDENLLRQLFAASKNDCTQLSIGAALVLKTRTEANSFTKYNEMACRIWSNCSGRQALEITVNAQPVDNTTDDACATWISNIEEAFTEVKTVQKKLRRCL